jgi:hypothetical protein
MELTHVFQEPTGAGLRLPSKDKRNVLADVRQFRQSEQREIWISNALDAIVRRIPLDQLSLEKTKTLVIRFEGKYHRKCHHLCPDFISIRCIASSAKRCIVHCRFQGTGRFVTHGARGSEDELSCHRSEERCLG